MAAARIITVRLFRTSAPDVTVYQIAMPEAEGLPFANMIAGALLDAAADASGDEFGYLVSTGAYHRVVRPGPMLDEVRALVAPPASSSAPPCRTQQWSDETVCITCGLRWDTNDEPPCPRVDSEGNRTDG